MAHAPPPPAVEPPAEATGPQPRRCPAKLCLGNEGRCRQSGRFNFLGIEYGQFCKKHALPGMVNVTVTRCAHPECSVFPVFNVKGSSRGVYCAVHKMPNMVNVHGKKCAAPECNRQPSFNVATQPIALYCSKHKLPDMINVINPRCLHDGCQRSRSFGMEATGVKLYCKEHASETMVCLRGRRCKQTGGRCNKTALFNVPYDSLPLYCQEHAAPGMERVKWLQCVQAPCRKRPRYNVVGDEAEKYCEEHKTPEMVDMQAWKMKTRLCSVEGCTVHVRSGRWGVALCGWHATVILSHEKARQQNQSTVRQPSVLQAPLLKPMVPGPPPFAEVIRPMPVVLMTPLQPAPAAQLECRSESALCDSFLA